MKGFGDTTEAHLKKVFTEILEVVVVEDGLVFDSSRIEVAPVRASVTQLAPGNQDLLD